MEQDPNTKNTILELQETQASSISLADAFEMGFIWASSLEGQTLEDSRSVGRTLAFDIFDPISKLIDQEILEQGFDSFKDAEHGIFQCKAIILSALKKYSYQTSKVHDEIN